MSAERSTWRVRVDYHACVGQQTCVEVCPTHVLAMRPTPVRNPLYWIKIKVRGGMQAMPVNPAACIGCMECVKACPEFAITVSPGLV